MSLVGNLEDLGLGEILQIVSLSRKSGTLALHSRGREGRIEFRFGQVTHARSTTFQQGLGEVLIQKGIIDQGTLKQALDLQEKGGFKERLGTILIKQFGVKDSVIEEVVREQIENIAYSLFTWQDGTFEFELQENMEEAHEDIKMDPLQFMLNQGLNPQFLAMEGSRLVDEKKHRGELVDDAPASDAANVDFAFDQLQAAPAPAPVQHKAFDSAERIIVVVDDDAATRSALTALFQGNGYTVHALEKSEEGLIKIDTLVRDGKNPTVLVDLIMPRMDGSGVVGGLELLELLRANFKQLPILAMTDIPNIDAERKVKSMGFAFIIKPRKGEVENPAVMGEFSGLIMTRLAWLESGETATNEKINIAEELRLEMGDDHFQPSSEPAVQSTGISQLRGMLEELNNPSLGGGIILLVLRFASEFMNRAVIFIVKKDEIVGLGQFGIDGGDGVDDARIRNMRIPRSEDSFFNPVIDSLQAMRVKPDGSKWNSYLFEQLGGTAPVEVFLGPIVSEGKVVAVLYGDNLPANTPIDDTDALEIFLSQAGIAMEKALLQRRLQEKR